MQLNKIYNQDCLLGMRELEENSIDALISDPPYQLSATGRGRPDQTKEGSYGKEVPFSRQQSRITKGFMGKDWDVLPTQEILIECLRVLKPGAWAMWCMTPRQDSYGIFLSRLSEAGFNIGFTSIYWAYASGFPKASNISKMIDKRNGRTSKEFIELGKYLRQLRGKRPQKDISKFFPSKTGGLTGCVANWELGLNVPTKDQWLILKRELNLDTTWDWLIEREEAEREVVGKAKWDSPVNGFMPDGSDKSERKTLDITASSTDLAKSFDGAYGGFQPKPAIEIIVVSMKGMTEKSYIDQAMKTGKGITWLDNCRIPYGSTESPQELIGGRASHTRGEGYGFNALGENALANTKGRFPANLLVSDDCLDTGNKTKATPGLYASGASAGIGEVINGHLFNSPYDDEGDFSRYFSLDSWFDEKMKELPKKVRRTFPFLVEPKADRGERNEGLVGDEKLKWLSGGGGVGITERENIKARNVHPSVKPISLMSYLITLTTRPREIVLAIRIEYANSSSLYTLEPFLISSPSKPGIRLWCRSPYALP